MSNTTLALDETVAPNPRKPLIRPIRSAAEAVEVDRITHDAYVAAGYVAPRPSRRLVLFPDHDRAPDTRILVAEAGGVLVGTASLCFDGPDGLFTDRYFPAETEAVRREGRRIAASYRIATRPQARRSRAVVVGLILEALDIALAAGVETCLMILHQKHGSAYARLLNARPVGTLDGVDVMDNYPCVLMRVDREDLPRAARRGRRS